MTIDNQQYEAGGSIIHERNKYVADFVKKFGKFGTIFLLLFLKVLSDVNFLFYSAGLKKRYTSNNDRLCIFNGEKYVFCESSWEIITLVKLLAYYGFDLIRLQKQVFKVIDYFEK